MFESNEQHAAHAMQYVATVDTKLQKIGESILALTDKSVIQQNS